MRSTRLPLRMSVVAVALVLVAALGRWEFLPTPGAAAAAPVDEAVVASSVPASFADVIEAVKPAVVNISTTMADRRLAGPRADGPFRGDPSFEEFFRRFFRRQSFSPAQTGMPQARAMGSGFIVDAAGLIVTNNHVIDGADEIIVTLNDGSRLPAELVGRDPKTDLALLEVQSDDALPFAAFGDSDDTRAGDWVIAIGNPFGLGGTATTGIVSARGRDIKSGPFDDFLQIDAPINHGNSGGPLFDTTGKVIGVNTAIYTPNGGSVGIGFAIPASQAAPIVAQLRENGRVARGWLGVQIQQMDAELAAGLGLETASGALVASVVDGSPAAAAGLVAGDVIVAFDGQPVDGIKDLTRGVAAAGPDRDIAMELVRGGGRTTVDVRLAANPEEVAAVRPATDARPGAAPLGLSLAPLTAGNRGRHAVEDDTDGVLVVGVDRGGAAAGAGVRPGDVIVRVGRDPVAAPADVRALVDRLREDDRPSVVLQIARGDSSRFVAVPLV